MIQEFLLALCFFTRLPAAKGWDFGGKTLARAAWAFPVAGAVIGLLTAFIYIAMLALGLASIIAAWTALACQLLLTGGLHEDGLADTADGMAYGRSREEKLAIMRDSRIGSYGVLALVTMLALRANAMAAFPGNLQAVWGFMAAAACSRAAITLLMRTVPPAKPEGLAAMAGQPSWPHTRTALLIGMVILLAGGMHAAAIGALALAVVYTIVSRTARRQFGGITGDVLGAMQQIGETVLLVTLGAFSG